jgi:hypothetical protein
MGSNLLERIGTFTIELRGGPFDTSKFFLPYPADPDALTQVSYHGNNFEEWFLDMNIVRGPSKANICCYKLKSALFDSQILSELGGEKAAIGIDLIGAMIEGQSHGEKGVLLEDGKQTLAYAFDKNKILRAMHINWAGRHGWIVAAASCRSSQFKQCTGPSIRVIGLLSP